jgi:hypothetical protein
MKRVKRVRQRESWRNTLPAGDGLFDQDYICSQCMSFIEDSCNPAEPIDIELGLVNEALLMAPSDYPFSSGQDPSLLIGLPRSITHRHLIQLLGFIIRHVRSAPF